MLDYHLHLWTHSTQSVTCTIEQLASYCEKAKSAGVVEIAVTEHLFRFKQATTPLGGFWKRDDISPGLRDSMQNYWDFHAHADLDSYVSTALAAKKAGLPIVVGMEVDYYQDQMDEVATLLSGYPFDVLLGSVHWLGAWRFDDLVDRVSMEEWTIRSVDQVWDTYTTAMEELADSRVCDVLAHPDLIKVMGHRPDAPDEWWDRLAEAAKKSGMAAEVSSAGWRKPVGVQYPDEPLLKKFIKADVPLTTASDAHKLEQVGDGSDDLRAILSNHNVTHLRGYRARKPRSIPIGLVDDDSQIEEL